MQYSSVFFGGLVAGLVFKYLYDNSDRTIASRFRILQMTDLHLLDIDSAFSEHQLVKWDRSETTERCLSKTLDLFRRIMDQGNPDLVVFTGDIVDGRGKTSIDQFWQDLGHLLKVCQDFNVPWLFLPGNHECDNKEGCMLAFRDQLLKTFRTRLI